MEWVKLSAVPAYYLDGALLRAGEPAEVLFCRGLAHCGAVESAGRIDKTVVPMLVPTRAAQRAAALVREGLWVDEGDHYQVRSWEKYQAEHDAAAALRAAARDRKRRERARRSSQDTVAASGVTSQDGHSVTSRDMSRDVTLLDREGEGDRESQPPTEVVEPTRASAKTTRGTRVPDTWPPPEQAATLAAWAREHTPAVLLVVETANWQDWHKAKGDTARDWAASWRTWMRRAQKDAETRGPRSGPVRTSTTDQRVAQGLSIVEHYARAEAANPEPAPDRRAIRGAR